MAPGTGKMSSFLHSPPLLLASTALVVPMQTRMQHTHTPVHTPTRTHHTCKKSAACSHAHESVLTRAHTHTPGTHSWQQCAHMQHVCTRTHTRGHAGVHTPRMHRCTCHVCSHTHVLTYMQTPAHMCVPAVLCRCPSPLQKASFLELGHSPSDVSRLPQLFVRTSCLCRRTQAHDGPTRGLWRVSGCGRINSYKTRLSLTSLLL